MLQLLSPTGESQTTVATNNQKADRETSGSVDQRLTVNEKATPTAVNVARIGIGLTLFCAIQNGLAI